MAKQYTYSNKGVKNYKGEELLKIPLDQAGKISTETRHIFQAVLNGLELKTMDDSIQGKRLADAIDEAEDKDVIVIGEGVYDWLKKKLEVVNRDGYQICPLLFRVNGEIVYDFIKEGFEKPHQPSKKKAGKGEKDDPPAEESGESEAEEQSQEGK